MENQKDLYWKALCCPLCGSDVALDDTRGAGVLLCRGPRTHTFDRARSGYVPLAPRHNGGGDAKEAVRSRTAFLSAGYYGAAADELCRLVKTHVKGGLILDAGCGEGYYTNHLAGALDEQYQVCGFDLSRDAVDAAAKSARRLASGAQFGVASLFELPVKDGSVAAVLNIFAPCAEREFCRVLEHEGVLILLGAGERHLLGLKRALYQETYENAVRADLPEDMVLCDHVTVRDEIVVEGRDQILNLFSMTPYYWRTSPADRSKLDRLEQLSTEIEFDCRVYRKK